jgi:hypothetical protein
VPLLAKAPAVVNVLPVAILVIIALWAARRLVKVASFTLPAAGALAWVRGGL